MKEKQFITFKNVFNVIERELNKKELSYNYLEWLCYLVDFSMSCTHEQQEQILKTITQTVVLNNVYAE